jgi:hypothetical protein
MSEIKYDEGQEISFNLGDFKEAGFLHGGTARIIEARFGKLTVPAQYQPQGNPIPDRIGAKFKLAVQKKDGTETVLERAQEYSTGIPWDNESVTVSNDGKRLIAKKSGAFKGFSKNCDFYHLLETAKDSGFPEDGFKGDLSVFDGLTFQMVSEPNPRTKDGKPKPFFGLLLNGGNGVEAAAGAVPAPAVPGNGSGNTHTPPSVSPAIIAAGVTALSAMIADSPTNSITRRDVAAKVPPIADKNSWDIGIRTGVMQALFDLPKLQVIAAAAGLKVNGETVSA